MEAEQLSSIVEQAKNQDVQAITQLYEEYHNGLYFLCLKIVKNEDDALDLVQDSFLQAFDKLETLQNTERFGSWLNQIAANKCRDYLKKKKPLLFSQKQGDEDGAGEEFEIEDRNETLIPDQSLDTQETRRLIMQIIDSLPDLQRMTVMLYYYEEKPVSEIAEIMECSENTVKSRLNYARKQIRASVLELEQKGTKLYGAMPMLFPLIQNAAADISLPAEASFSLLNSITSSLQAGAAQGAACAAEGTTTVQAAAGAAPEITGKASAAIQHTVAQFWKLSLPMKIGSGMIVAVVIAGIGLGASALMRQSVPAQTALDGANPVSSEVSFPESSALSADAAVSAIDSSAPVSSVPAVVPVTEIALSKTEVSLTVGQKIMPLVTMSPEDATDKGEVWSSSDEKIATVDQSGNIKAIGTGTCTVTVTSKSNPGISQNVRVSVSKKASLKEEETKQQDNDTEKIRVKAYINDAQIELGPDNSLTISFSELNTLSSSLNIPVDSANLKLNFIYENACAGGIVSGFWGIDTIQISDPKIVKVERKISGILLLQVMEKGSVTIIINEGSNLAQTITIQIV